MARASKRAKMTATSTMVPADSANSKSGVVAVSAAPPPFLPFQAGPSLERIPDGVLQEILSHLPTLSEHHVLLGNRGHPPVIPSAELVRTPVLRALSQTSQLLRARCLVMAWCRVELCGASLPKHEVTFYRAIGDATKTAVRVLNACPHLLPLIRTVSVILTRFQSAEIIPAFAACLATLPNLTTIQVIHAHSQMMTAIKKGFEGQRFSSVRRVSLLGSAHDIIKSCPNLEEVISVEGDGSRLIGSLIKGNCHQVRIIKGITAPLTRLIKLLPNLRHIGVPRGQLGDTQQFMNFPLLDTIEITDYYRHGRVTYGAPPLTDLDPELKGVIKILKENKSRAEKTVILTPSKDSHSDSNVTSKVIKV